ncbi:T9SS type A sorting domain-containing protein [Paraflavitalea sp. CAU 1676]|uniref:T9SS type A sorting domain-containing protein n=1 Tax=Paraflavitalea sp. CAU 1676 TaxID=3032598 RepID=UPI0023DB77CC|nr:T9SS type A sorting domain-containing protein [Paraflavitalea sp. CAU 1676]MDF2187266.1 T9SS type A sorting domain-containing protein [Paraflavitalea sp. CAU 1676]
MKTYLYLTADPKPITLQHIFRWLLLPLLLLTWSLTSFSQNVKSNGGKKIVLNWSTAVDDNYSHFVIERSIDNTTFSEVGYLFTGEEEAAGRNVSYSFSDDVKNVRKGYIYYRINMVDMKGRVQKSVKHTVYTAEHKATPTVKVSPNPMINELRVALPAAWKGKFVSIELINNLNGQVAKYVLNQQALLTEILPVAELTEGIYILRVSNGNETIIQRVVKSK